MVCNDHAIAGAGSANFTPQVGFQQNDYSFVPKDDEKNAEKINGHTNNFWTHPNLFALNQNGFEESGFQA